MLIAADQIVSDLEKKGFHYPKEVIFNYLISLKTKPFVILTGISGSGKSKIAELIAEEFTTKGIKNYELIPVKPNWKDSKGLFGYHNIIDNSYYITPAITLFLKALKYPEISFFLILDEMNMAKTEQYFADYLSLIESRRYNNNANQPFYLKNNDIIYNEQVSLSDAIILSAIDINNPSEELDIADYRANRFSIAWQNQFFNGNNWTAQYRSELNQGDGRFAHRVFEGGNGKYKLKNLSSIENASDRAQIEKLKKMYLELGVKKEDILQQNIKLHNCNRCIDSLGNTCDKNCTLCDSQKYRCPYLYNPDTSKFFIPPELPIPLNLYTVGTVNIDETTNMFSPKVLDRCNIIEFNNVDFQGLYNLSDDIQEILKNSNISFSEDFYFKDNANFDLSVMIPSKSDVNSYLSSAKDSSKDLFKIFVILQKYNMHFGYRVMNEISAYLINVKINTDCDKWDELGLDNQIYQKILPKMFGNYEKLWKPLTEILEVMSVNQIKFSNCTDWESVSNIVKDEDMKSLFTYPKSAAKICSMLQDIENTGFTSFIK